MADTAHDPFFDAFGLNLEEALAGVLSSWAQHPELIESTAQALDADGRTDEATTLRGFAASGPKARQALVAGLHRPIATMRG